MAVRVSASEVKEIISTSIADATLDSSMIANASLLVDELFATTSLSAERLKMIELYLAAHFVAITDEKGALTETAYGDARDGFANVYGEGFNSTRYGQMAISLDTEKKLAEQASTEILTAQFRVV